MNSDLHEPRYESHEHQVERTKKCLTGERGLSECKSAMNWTSSKEDDVELESNGKVGGSKIANFYVNRSILITGASGFLGKVFIEKLLRSCPLIKCIFVLIRPKRNMSPASRLAELLESPLFDQVRKLDAGFGKKVVLVEGDVTEPNLGMDESSLAKVINEVSVIFHSAATVKFDEPLKLSLAINVEGTQRMIELCRRIGVPQLAAMVHISTAYANCELDNIDEHVYPTQMEPDDMINIGRCLDQETVQTMKQRLLRSKPNTYTYTKALAEWMIVQSARDLPVVICRPSIVCATWKEPFAGWIDNVNGPTGVMLGAGKGLIRSMLADKGLIADLVPVDMVVNTAVSLGWFAKVYQVQKNLDSQTPSETNDYEDEMRRSLLTSFDFGYSSGASLSPDAKSIASSSSSSIREQTVSLNQQMTGQPILEPHIEERLKRFRQDTRERLDKKGLPGAKLRDVPVFHCTSGRDNPITWRTIQVLSLLSCMLNPSIDVYRYPGGNFTKSRLRHQITSITLHYLPAYILDFFSRLVGAKPILVKIYRKFDQAVNVLTDFTLKQWNFSSDNRLMLIKDFMSEEDQKEFNCDIRNLDWAEYFNNYSLGVRSFVLKESVGTLKEARRRLNITYYRNLSLQITSFAGLIYSCVQFANAFTSVVSIPELMSPIHYILDQQKILLGH